LTLATADPTCLAHNDEANDMTMDFPTFSRRWREMHDLHRQRRDDARDFLLAGGAMPTMERMRQYYDRHEAMERELQEEREALLREAGLNPAGDGA
jgi:8-oxo-dGTP pyrophosphatase MutT (NUDIX family)